jgi:hypothetical protein
MRNRFGVVNLIGRWMARAASSMRREGGLKSSESESGGEQPMSHGIAERDWKILRELHPVALNRFCTRILEEIENVAADASRSPHQRYRAIYELIDRRDDDIADAFDDMRRSMAIMRIAYMRRLGVLTDEEFARFSEETRDTLQILSGPARR